MSCRSVPIYQGHIEEFRRAEASDELDRALIQLDKAIEACPVDEALPYLKQERKKLKETITRSVSVTGRLASLIYRR